AAPEERARIQEDAAVLELDVPPDATVRIDGTDQGKRRRFEMGPFQPGRTHGYEVAVTLKDGEQVRRTVYLRGGWHVRLPVAPSASARPELVVQAGHAGKVRAAAFRPESEQVLTAAEDGTAILWDI